MIVIVIVIVIVIGERIGEPDASMSTKARWRVRVSRCGLCRPRSLVTPAGAVIP
ncbi:hypothetical protein [Sphingomonas sp. OK281]|uniref:hypothetical protein n=1 Tax=Sphingomonas sp. OK281 TaxID=1881067 RepID=UPI0015870608|nr:hypothetical protein [Sphingomonas sp. OK281]